MFTGINRVALRLVSSALLAAVLAHRGAEAAELKVCVDRNSPTAKVDAALARATARIQGTTAQIVGFDGGSDDDDDGLAPRVFRKLAATQCQLVLGFPLDAQSGAPPEGLRATQPYGRTGFVLVTRARTQASLDQLPRGSEVAVTYMTAPNLYFENHPALTPQVFTSDAASLRALRRGEVAAAMLWRPSVAAQLHGTLRMTALSEPHASWNLVALYAEDSQAVAQGFELAIAELRRSGRLAALLRPYADPAEAPAAHTAVVPESLVRSWPRGRLIAVADKKSAAKALPALYTAQQAEAGEHVFQQNCAMCHGPKLEGRAGPALKGPTFASPQAHFSVGDVFKIVSLNMPAPAPGTLPHDDYVNVMAFLLQQNGYPAGAQPLSFDDASKSKVKLIYREAHAD
jgi:mono/diheme cytochrome c family protein